ncbi:hypothetical protein GOBAR_AA22903 [Gossypium barbadense]|uniref:MULE transposase domain-containing protein n=1 Tax=Gossypium barbadense TaxID=3634 RepID=A0A2P5X346_GOSBA|nr:hypothetical protein GOBAR_AA22903 [Gossypium barbadense]
MSNFYRSNLNEGNEISMATSLFFTDRSREELMQWVQNTTFSLGYIIVTRRSKAKENGVVSYVTLICDCGSEYKFKESSKKFGTKKTNCKFRLVGSYLKQYDGWTLRMICDQHNHPPAQHMEGHAYARRLKENEKKLLGDLTSKNVTPRDVLSTLKEQDENNISTLKTIYNARKKLHSSQNVDKTPIQFSVNNISNELENLFFIHPRSLDIWRTFLHVLIVDATYKTNKYDLSFVQITFSIAFVIIINEKEENYNWALTCLKLTLEECMHPCVIVTDRELALMNACQQVFPDATQLLFESQHAKLKKYFCAKNSSLDKFVGCIDQIVKSQLTLIYESFEKSRIVLKHRHNLPCFRLLRGFVALEALDILEGELQRSSRHQLDSSNCAIFVCLGYGEDQWLYVRHQLLDELLSSYYVYARVFTDGIDELRNSLCFSQSPAPAEHWMVMPMTGILIANRFGVILNYLTKRGDITFFPLWRGPEHFQYHHAITIAHVYDNHNVMVQLEGDYPMPTISAYWIRHRSLSTAGWQTMYMSCLEFYTQLKPCNLKTPVITIEDYC